MSQFKAIDITNKKFGKLTAIESLNKKDKRNRYIWKFQCECGNNVEATASDVKLGRKRSCGCLIQEHCNRLAINRILPNLGGAKQKLFGRYKRDAKKRGIDFILSKEEFNSLLFNNCYYCGSEPYTKLCIMHDEKKKTDEYTLIYNGIDRTDNDKGYNMSNCVTCCGKCNKMKMDMNKIDFLKHLNKILHNLGDKYE